MQGYAWNAKKKRNMTIRNKNVLDVLKFSAIFFGIVLLDQLTKFFAANYVSDGMSKEVIKNFLNITSVSNTGIAFGLFRNSNIFLIILSFLVLITLFSFRKVFFERFFSKVGLILMLSGITGNLIDRIRLGYIVDFIDLNFWPVFNLSDASIFLGVIFLCIQYFSRSVR